MTSLMLISPWFLMKRTKMIVDWDCKVSGSISIICTSTSCQMNHLRCILDCKLFRVELASVTIAEKCPTERCKDAAGEYGRSEENETSKCSSNAFVISLQWDCEVLSRKVFSLSLSLFSILHSFWISPFIDSFRPEGMIKISAIRMRGRWAEEESKHPRTFALLSPCQLTFLLILPIASHLWSPTLSLRSQVPFYFVQTTLNPLWPWI